jgi:hypothetical protein|tara:strand:- start:53 stop:538 length:486 start_codon:yes stop_codon:yes gene_type:complete
MVKTLLGGSKGHHKKEMAKRLKREEKRRRRSQITPAETPAQDTSYNLTILFYGGVEWYSGLSTRLKQSDTFYHCNLGDMPDDLSLDVIIVGCVKEGDDLLAKDFLDLVRGEGLTSKLCLSYGQGIDTTHLAGYTDKMFHYSEIIKLRAYLNTVRQSNTPND